MTPAISPPTLVYSARFYEPRPKVRSYFHLYEFRAGQKSRPRQLTNGNHDDFTVRPAPNGRDVFFVRDGDGDPPRVCCLNRQTGSVRTIFVGQAKTTLPDVQVSPKSPQPQEMEK